MTRVCKSSYLSTRGALDGYRLANATDRAEILTGVRGLRGPWGLPHGAVVVPASTKASQIPEGRVHTATRLGIRSMLDHQWGGIGMVVA